MTFVVDFVSLDYYRRPSTQLSLLSRFRSYLGISAKSLHSTQVPIPPISPTQVRNTDKFHLVNPILSVVCHALASNDNLVSWLAFKFSFSRH